MRCGVRRPKPCHDSGDMERTLSCPSCQRALYPEDAFCGQCGTRVQARGADTGTSRRTLARQTIPTLDRFGCGSCNSPILPGELFCSTCGARTTQPDPGTRPDVWATTRRNLEEATRGKLEFVRELGTGGMGTVFLARELELDRYVAVKVLSASWLTDAAMVERFRREARTIARLRHPSIVHVHGVGRAGDLHYFIMDYIEGVSLGRVLRAFGPLSIPAVQAVLYQVGSALSYAHRPGRGVIHRDVKPGNIMIDTEGNSFVTDFGISKVSESAASGLTMTGLIMGTPEYMSPEQCRGDTVTHASDQYALGAVGYAMLTGAPPFTGQHYRVLMAHTTEPPPPLRELRPDCPPELASTIERMLAKLPAERWPDITDGLKAARIRPAPPDDPVREELSALVRRVESGTAGTDVSRSPAARDARTPTWLRILSIPDSVEAGDEIDLRVTLGYADGREEESREVRWESTDPSIARVDPSTGQLVALKPGEVVITAWAGGIAESANVQVQAERTVRLEVSPSTLTLETGEARAVESLPRSRRGRALERTVLWSSSDPGIASVADDGVIRAHREGTVSILAHCEGVGAAMTVNVVPARVAAVRILDAPARLVVGHFALLRAEITAGSGQRVEAIPHWSSSAPGIVRVRDDGRVEAMSPGSAEVLVACEGHAASVVIQVRPLPVASVVIRSAPGELRVTEEATLRAAALDAQGNELDRPVHWSSADDGVLRVTADGHAAAMSPGRTSVRATCEEVHARLDVRVLPAPVARLEIPPPPAGLVVGDVFHLTATAVDTRDRPADADVDWRADGAAVLESLGGGRFRAVGDGRAAAVATAGDVTVRVPLSVAPLRVASLTIEAPDRTGLVGTSVRLRALTRDQRQRPIDATVRWTSTDPGIAAVADDGTVRFETPGEVTITAEAGGMADRLRLSVRPPSVVAEGRGVTGLAGGIGAATPVQDRDISPAEPESATALFSTDMDGEAWDPASVPPTVIAPMPAEPAAPPVDADPTVGSPVGKLVRVGVPVAIVAVALVAWLVAREPADGRPTQADIGMPSPPEAVSLVLLDGSGAALDAEAIEVVAGDTVELVARVVDAGGVPIPDAFVEWSSSDAAVATVSVDGRVIALAGGAARLAARTEGASRELAVTVRPRQVAATPRPPAPARPTETTSTGRAAVQPPATGMPPEPPRPQNGVLRLVIIPWANVYIDGELRAEGAPRLELTLPVGSHRIRLENPNMMTVDTIVQIRPGAPTQLRFPLAPRSP